MNLEEDEELMERRNDMKKKDSKINGLQDKLKKAEEMAEMYKSEVASLELNLNFYKQKLQEEC